MIISFFRTIILYAFVIAMLRIMGKKQVGELEPTELVITIMISELATLPMQETGIPIVSGAVPIITLVLLQACLSYAQMKSKKLRRIVGGQPTMLIYDGKVLLEQMRSIHFNRDDLMEELRLAGCANIGDVRYAILETNGQLSVVLKREKQPAAREDVQNKQNKSNKSKK